MSRALLSVAVVLASVFPAFAADEAYTIKRYKEKEGDVTKRALTLTNDTKMTTTVGDKTDTGRNKEGIHYVETVELLKYPADAKHATKWKRTFEKCDQTDATGKTAPNALEGKTVVTEFTDGKAAHTVDDKPATAELVALLDGMYVHAGSGPGDFSDGYLPTKPVKVGDTWEVDLKKMGEADPTKGASFDLKRSSATGKLVKAAKKNGAVWGTLEVEARLVVPPPAADDKNTPAQGEGEMTVKMSIEMCLDGTVPGETLEGTMGVNFTVKLSGDGKSIVTGTATMKTNTEPVTKK